MSSFCIRAQRGALPGNKRRRAWSLLAGLVAVLLVFGASSAAGELVLLVNGSVLKVSSFELRGERVQLELRGGGVLELSILQVDRILDDELVPEPPAPETPPFSLRYAEAQPAPEGPYGELIFSAAQRHGLNPKLVAAVARAESAFAPRAVSHKGAQGLMQLMPATAQRFGLSAEEVFEPAKNLDVGARYLRWLADRFDDRLLWVLAGYNAGEGAVDRYGGVPPYRETQQYIERILRTLGLEAESQVASGG